MADLLVVDKPVVDKPVVDKPMVDKRMVDKPVADEPMVDKRIEVMPVLDKPLGVLHGLYALRSVMCELGPLRDFPFSEFYICCRASGLYCTLVHCTFGGQLLSDQGANGFALGFLEIQYSPPRCFIIPMSSCLLSNHLLPMRYNTIWYNIIIKIKFHNPLTKFRNAECNWATEK